MDKRRILVIANETVVDLEVPKEIFDDSQPGELDVVVVSPALNSRLRHWVSDDDGARANAKRRLETTLATLGKAGVEARGQVGDADPLLAIKDALATVGADEIVISSHEPERANRLERKVTVRARRLVDLPIKEVAGRPRRR
jgi:hypothetical protein